MKNIRIHLAGIIFFCVSVLSSFAQNTLSISANTDLFISAGTVFYAEGMALKPAADLTITGANELTKNAVAFHATANPYIKRVYRFSSTLPSYSGDIAIYYDDTELNGIVENDLTLYVHNGTSWNAVVTNVTKDATNNFVSIAGASGTALNELTLASLSGTVPVIFTSFHSVCLLGEVQLSWKTAQEFNSKNFEIERSADHISWENIGSVSAAGSSNTEHTYSFTDDQPGSNVFYRIIQNDIDGKKTVGSIIRSSCTTKESFMIYPNPARNKIAVNLYAERNSSINLRLLDSKGAAVKETHSSLLKGNNQLEINISGLPQGIYTLISRWDGQIKVNKIVKE